MFGREPVELGLAGREAQLFARLRAEARYAALRRAFPGEADCVHGLANVARAIASFERTLVGVISLRPPGLRRRPDGAVEAARRGAELFISSGSSASTATTASTSPTPRASRVRGAFEARSHHPAEGGELGMCPGPVLGNAVYSTVLFGAHK